MTNLTNSCQFSHSKADIFWGKNYKWFGAGAWLLIFIVDVYQRNGELGQFQLFSVFFVLPLMATLLFLWYLALFKQAYKVAFDFEQKIFSLNLYRGNKIVTCQLEELKCIKLDWFSVFVLSDGRTVWFKYNENFVEFILKTNLKRKWGFWGKKFGKQWYDEDLKSYSNGFDS